MEHLIATLRWTLPMLLISGFSACNEDTGMTYTPNQNQQTNGDGGSGDSTVARRDGSAETDAAADTGTGITLRDADVGDVGQVGDVGTISFGCVDTNYQNCAGSSGSCDLGNFTVASKSDTHHIPSLNGFNVSLRQGESRTFTLQTENAGRNDRPDTNVYINGSDIKSTVEFSCDNGGESRLNCFGSAQASGDNTCIATTTGNNQHAGGQIACSSHNNYTATITLEAPSATTCTSANLRIHLTQ